jgi:peptidyl-tRNA hydrolase
MDPPEPRPDATEHHTTEHHTTEVDTNGEEPGLDAAETWAMQLAVWAEKIDPPAHSAVCVAAAMAVARVLTEPDPGWQEAIRRWEAGPVRKVTRRARGVRWTAVQRLPGVTVDYAGARVRAFVPGPRSQVPPELARLQVAGLDLPDVPTAPDSSAGGLADRPRSSPAPPDAPYAAIALNPDVQMSTGKAAAQCGHAVHLLVRQAAEPDLPFGRDRPDLPHWRDRPCSAWLAAGLPVRLTRGEPWARSVARAAVAVHDAGFTEVPPGTMTAVAWFVTEPPL